MTILSGLVSMVLILALHILGPLFFVVGILCIHIWGRKVRGIVLCAVGLVLMILTNHLAIWIMEKQKEEIKQSL